jgi:hypothetical protein
MRPGSFLKRPRRFLLAATREARPEILRVSMLVVPLLVGIPWAMAQLERIEDGSTLQKQAHCDSVSHAALFVCAA